MVYPFCLSLSGPWTTYDPCIGFPSWGWVKALWKGIKIAGSNDSCMFTTFKSMNPIPPNIKHPRNGPIFLEIPWFRRKLWTKPHASKPSAFQRSAPPPGPSPSWDEKSSLTLRWLCSDPNMSQNVSWKGWESWYFKVFDLFHWNFPAAQLKSCSNELQTGLNHAILQARECQFFHVCHIYDG